MKRNDRKREKRSSEMLKRLLSALILCVLLSAEAAHVSPEQWADRGEGGPVTNAITDIYFDCSFGSIPARPGTPAGGTNGLPYVIIREGVQGVPAGNFKQ